MLLFQNILQSTQKEICGKILGGILEVPLDTVAEITYAPSF